MMTTQTFNAKLLPDGNVKIFRKCPFCGKEHSIVKPYGEYSTGLDKTRQGILVQDAFPNWTPSERELIMTGICDACWANM